MLKAAIRKLFTSQIGYVSAVGYILMARDVIFDYMHHIKSLNVI